MNLRAVTNAIASVLIIVGAAMLTAVPVGLAMGDPPAVLRVLLYCALGTMAVSGLVVILARHGQTLVFGFHEGFAVVSLSWVAATLVGALPYLLIADLRWYDAIFETMSGFTTTGASVIERGLPLRSGGALSQGLADLPAALLYWRALTHWLGGMGIVVLSVAIMPWLGLGAQQLFRAEVPGPTHDRITPRIADSAKILWGVYLTLTLLQTGLLCLSGMSWFDAWCHACATVATGGFSTRQESLAFYHSATIEAITILFMFLSGVNFLLHYRALRGEWRCLWKDEEFRFYTAVCLLATASIALVVTGRSIVTTAGEVIPSASYLTSLRYAAFQVVSIVTTTGFVTADFNPWPAYCAAVLVLLMYLGGCAGSTAGGMKQSRILLLLRYGVFQVERCLFRRTMSNVRFNGQRIDPIVLHKILAFFFLFMAINVAVTLALCLLGVGDLVTAATATLSSLANVGPGLGQVGATSTYAWMPPAAKLLLSFTMLLGRLELYTVLVMFLPSFYR
ncbi:MAG: TrkH family potassium uptake protein [Lentisphaerae bacterium]|nr:TrkH family potassium uptake protein [Lentisphaerota bacterium]